MKTTESRESVCTEQVSVQVLRRRIDHLIGARAFINGTSSQHKDMEAFQSIIDWAIRECEIEPVELAKAFEVNTATVSRWRTGKNAPHPHMRPHIIAWIKDRIGNRIDALSSELGEDCEPPTVEPVAVPC